MTQQLARQKNSTPVTVEQALVLGDLSGLDPEQRVNYYLKVCSSLGINPYTKPFDYLMLNGKLVLYARKDCTDQLRSLHKVSITRLDREQIGDLYVATAYGSTRDGRADSDIGAVNVKGLSGDNLANAMLKAVTKAKRRLTLALCGLGMLDETEVDSIPGAYAPEEETYIPTREQETDDRDLVRSADERIWKRYLQLIDEARGLGLNVKPEPLPIDRALLKQIGLRLTEAIDERKEQLDNEEAARIAAQAHVAAAERDEDLDAIEHERQQRLEGVK